MVISKILVMNGPNLDMLGVREPQIYGRQTLASVEEDIADYGARFGIQVDCYQSNSEGKLIEKIHKAPAKYDAIVYNPGAHTHYSYALRDAVGSVSIPVVEVHISAIDEREPFRSISVIAPACVAQVKGLGTDGYLRAVDILRERTDFRRLGEGFEEKLEGHPAIVVADGLGEEALGEFAGGAGAAGASDGTGKLFRDGLLGEQTKRNAALSRARHANASFGAHGVASKDTRGPAADLLEPFRASVEELDVAGVSEERQTLLRLACSRLGVGALLVRDTANIHWLTALDGVMDEERAHGLLVAANMAVLHTDSRYANAFRQAIAQAQSPIMVSDEAVSHARFAYDILTQDGESEFGGKLGIEDTITYAEFVKMVEQFQAEGLAPTSDVVLKLRAVKDSGEVARMKAAQVITDAAFSHIVEYMEPGMTEREVQLELEDFMARHGARELAFRSIVATGANGADPHAIPGDTRLEAGQCVVLDFGAKAFGYCSDMTRTVFLGEPDIEMSNAWDAIRSANELAQGLLVPGITGKEVHEAAEAVLADNGFGGMMGHGLGHGVGLDVHELPVLSPKNELPLSEGNVVTVEPGIYIPGRFGMRLEDFGVITANGFDVFTQSTHEMVII